MTTTLLRDAAVFDAERARAGTAVEPTDVAVVDGTIAAVGAGAARAAGIVDGRTPDGEPVEVVDLAGRVVIPGLVNAHLHSNQTLEAGLCDELPLDAYLVLASYGGAGARLSPRDLHVSVLVGALDMLTTGCTSVIDCARTDHEWFDQGMDEVCRAYEAVGLRAGVAAQYSDLDYMSSIPGWLVGHGPPGQVSRHRPDEVLRPARDFIERWRDRSPLVRPMLAPSSLPRCSIELFEASVALSNDLGAPIQTHLLSGKGQVEVGHQRYSGSTVAFLDRIGALTPGSSYAHSIWLDDAEIELMGASGAVAVHNPSSNLKLGAGLAPVPELLAAGVPVALGTDGGSSSDNLNMFEMVKLAAVVQRVRGPLAPGPRAADALAMAWEAGGALMDVPTGRIAPGHAADLVVLDPLRFSPGPAAQIANQLVFAELGRSVQSVYVAGRLVVDHGTVVGIDEAAIRAEAREIRDRLWAGLPDRLRRFEEALPGLVELEQAVDAMRLDFDRYVA